MQFNMIHNKKFGLWAYIMEILETDLPIGEGLVSRVKFFPCGRS